MIHKIVNKEAPEYITEAFILIYDGTAYKHNLALQNLNTEYLKNSFYYRRRWQIIKPSSSWIKGRAAHKILQEIFTFTRSSEPT